MKVLIVCPQTNDQVLFLAAELEKMSLKVEITESFHPLRILLNKYDIIHFIHNDQSMSLKTILSAWSAKTIGIATVFTTYCRLESSMLKEFEFNFFDAMTLPCISELKKMRFFSGPKLILPSLPAYMLNQKNDFSSEVRHFIFPVLKNFDDLLKINLQALPSVSKQEHLYIDAHFLKSANASGQSSMIRKKWAAFVKKNPQFAKFKLFTELSTLKEVLNENLSYTFIYHLDLNSQQIAFWMETALVYKNFLILNEDQGTGFANFWKTEKNCLIFSPRFSAITQLHAIDRFISEHQSLNQISFDFRGTLDIKLNELARLYTKIASQRASLNQPKSAKM